jgi:hypothetical protein
MARARTIKPQFLRSRSMRRVSRDAQLTFIKLWLVVDDAGRVLEGVHGMGLFPGDEEARRRLPEWLAELEREHCIERYTVEKLNYLRIVNWRRHQKIYHPTPSRLPARPPGPAAENAPPAQPISRATHEPSGAIHEALGSDGEKASLHQGLGSVREIPERFVSAREPLGNDAAKPLRGGLLGRFHERFMRRSFFSARTSFSAPSPADARRDRPR